MLIEATDEQVKTMGALAANASEPMGMGFLHYDGGTTFKPEDFKLDPRGFFPDYVQGRMVKLRMWRKGPNSWEIPDEARPDYESWCGKYPSYTDLARAAGVVIGGER